MDVPTINMSGDPAVIQKNKNVCYVLLALAIASCIGSIILGMSKIANRVLYASILLGATLILSIALIVCASSLKPPACNDSYDIKPATKTASWTTPQSYMINGASAVASDCIDASGKVIDPSTPSCWAPCPSGYNLTVSTTHDKLGHNTSVGNCSKLLQKCVIDPSQQTSYTGFLAGGIVFTVLSAIVLLLLARKFLA
uniref:Uncharacterized protein n=1 Tax=viral metagenome TaxID=1070528 RepID=A0A6C0KEP0_9ZZZZ